MKVSELKRCPFCGGAAQRSRVHDEKGGAVIIQCRRGKCCATLAGADDQEAMAMWNRRVEVKEGK
jgi:Lar family restriction alleviation protein